MYLLAFAVFVAVIVGSILLNKKSPNKERKETLNLNEPFPFVSRYLMSKREQQLYWRLLETLPDCLIMSQVSIMGVLNVKKEHYRHSFKYTNQVDRLRLDFVICRKDTYPLAVIELDDSSHDNERQQARDDKKDKALTDAGIKIIRWREIPDSETIKTALQGLI